MLNDWLNELLAPFCKCVFVGLRTDLRPWMCKISILPLSKGERRGEKGEKARQLFKLALNSLFNPSWSWTCSPVSLLRCWNCSSVPPGPTMQDFTWYFVLNLRQLAKDHYFHQEKGYVLGENEISATRFSRTARPLARDKREMARTEMGSGTSMTRAVETNEKRDSRRKGGW